MYRSLQEVGCYITSQFGNIAPADKVSTSLSHDHTLSALICSLDAMAPIIRAAQIEIGANHIRAAQIKAG